MPTASENSAKPTLGKSSHAFRTIREVATELNIPQHVLRFWEGKFPQVTPTRKSGGRRYYRPADIKILRQIRSFLYDDGYTIKGVQKLLKNSNQDLKKQSTSPNTNGTLPSSRSERIKLEQIRDMLSELENIRKLL
mgnify:CR=1 FL=1